MTNEEQKKQDEVDGIKIRVISEDDRRLKPMEHSINFEYTSPVDNKLYTGDFTFKKFNLGGLSRVGVLKAQRQAGFLAEQLDEATGLLNHWIAHLQVWLEGSPNLPTWAKDWNSLVDMKIPFRLYEEGASFEATFRHVVGERSGTPPVDSGAEPQK